MLSYDLDSYDGPLYEKIYKSIKDDVYAGRIHPGEKLPSKRKLAATLDVSVITVENAYGQLQAEGYVHSYQIRGYFIAELPGIATGYRRIKSEATREEYNQKRRQIPNYFRLRYGRGSCAKLFRNAKTKSWTNRRATAFILCVTRSRVF